MPEVAEAVVVAAPDERFGERVVAVLRIRPGQAMLPDRGRVHTRTSRPRGWPRQKWPEDVREVEDYPGRAERESTEIPGATTQVG